MWTATVLTLFPDMFPGPLGASLAGKALASGLWQLETRDIRDAATDRHRSVDDTPAGGGAGMVLRADVVARAFDALSATQGRPRLLMSPRGVPLTQARVAEFASGPGPIIVCGRFEGVDQRVIEARNLEEVSVGDYVLSGGELAAMILIDACVRLLPGVMGNLTSAQVGELFRRPAGVPAIHPPGGVRRPNHPRGADLRRSRQGRRLAPRGSREADEGAARSGLPGPCA